MKFRKRQFFKVKCKECGKFTVAIQRMKITICDSCYVKVNTAKATKEDYKTLYTN